MPHMPGTEQHAKARHIAEADSLSHTAASTVYLLAAAAEICAQNGGKDVVFHHGRPRAKPTWLDTFTVR